MLTLFTRTLCTRTSTIHPQGSSQTSSETSTRAYLSPQHQDVAEIAERIHYGNVRDFLNLTSVAIRGHAIPTCGQSRPLLICEVPHSCGTSPAWTWTWSAGYRASGIKWCTCCAVGLVSVGHCLRRVCNVFDRADRDLNLCSTTVMHRHWYLPHWESRSSPSTCSQHVHCCRDRWSVELAVLGNMQTH
jgi:hypothetical protein